MPHVLCTFYVTRVNVDGAHPIVTLKLRTATAMANASVLLPTMLFLATPSR